MFCEKCGNKTSGRFCPNCGYDNAINQWGSFEKNKQGVKRFNDLRIEFRILIVVGFIAVATLIIAAIFSTVNKSDNPANKADNTPKQTMQANAGYSPTTGEKNALKSAKDYLRVMAFSRSSLINQLEFEGYTYDEAKYGADNCGANWNEQAERKAKEYLKVMSYSRSGLINQLEYEGFTTAQAEYGVQAVGY